ncbi:unnamed protein product [Microthlaspi erraticum]|uniref:Uncharacterized protein n=1 Tax=Microthlaspi erraticum TaxID=1685480 RepID=A0A6D2IZA1_9BRAS|nr:unnamed protein product [Microthlaspi erraticum]
MEDDDYSASTTTVVFDRPIPLLRGPIPAGGSEFVLAFRSMDSWAAAFKRCETLLKEQCEEGARIGCAVSASNNCKPPWWRWRGSGDMREREKCEEREFKECCVAAKDKCAGFAQDKCSAALLDARVAVSLASMPEDSTWTNCRARDLLPKKSSS